MMPLNLQSPEKQTDNSELLDVITIWSTIQGEGPFAGIPAVFIRLAGCDLQCPLCFGVGTKSNIPFLSLSVGAKKRLDKIEEGDVVLTFNEDFELVETEVKRVLYRNVGKWLEIRIAGKTYDVTPEHPFFTTEGIVEARDLCPGDVVLECRPNEIISFKKLGDRNPMKDPEVSAKSAVNTDWEAMGKKVSATRKAKFASGELTAVYHLMSPIEQEEFKQRISRANRREGNGNWSGKYTNLLDLKELLDGGGITRCERCLRRGYKLLVHHLDGDHSNDSKSNLTVWCHRCHNRHHQRGYNFWNGKREDGKKLLQDHNGQTVERVVRHRGILPVVNISCKPYPTYLANGMWVHNCDTQYTTGRKLLPFGVVFDQVQECRSSGLVVITGGEPFRQNLYQLLVQFRAWGGYNIQIETNGTLWWDWIPKADLTIVCSPKTPKLHPELLDYIDAYKYVLEAGKVDHYDGLPTSALGMSQPPARPHPDYSGDVFVQPLDSADPEANQRNLDATVQSCLKFGYRLGLQMHKIIGLE